jgi:hypothetical protein
MECTRLSLRAERNPHPGRRHAGIGHLPGDVIPSSRTESRLTSQDPVESTRGLLSENAVLRHGFDVLGESTSTPVPTVAQRAMNSPFVATVYDQLWRPTAFYIGLPQPTRAT